MIELEVEPEVVVVMLAALARVERRVTLRVVVVKCMVGYVMIL